MYSVKGVWFIEGLPACLVTGVIPYLELGISVVVRLK